ncbi:MAG: DUF444 family protein [Alphaproteobacteria bacterium]|nr:DUF444 family protein [Alphaproteobacteria bacterium]
MHVIDRRLNPKGKSLANRQRFVRRARAQVRRAVRDISKDRSIKDFDKGGEVTIPAGGVHEPTLRRSASGGVRDYLLPGNKDYIEGDTIARPPSGDGASGPSDSGDGEDGFRFALSDDEFLDLFLEDLELPDMAKREVTGEAVTEMRRAGYRTTGSPASISIPRTMRLSMSRRIALKRPRPEEIAALKEEIAALEADSGEGERLESLRAQLDRLQRRAKVIPYLDPLDVRYRRFEAVPKPVAQAVMFCLMDVSGSMDEHMKDLAKRFYALLYLFLKRRYERVEVVFIRHTHQAEEVDEQTFFYSRETGGTVVSTALEEMARVVTARFPLNSWNIYAAQASDGDNSPSDNTKTAALLNDVILPMCQYYAYLEVGADEDDLPIGAPSGRPSSLWRTYEAMVASKSPIAMRKVRHRREIFPVFRDLFQRRQSAEAS